VVCIWTPSRAVIIYIYIYITTGEAKPAFDNHTNIYINIYIYTYIHTYIHTYIYI
jgi:hypothetical protein